MAKGKGPNFQLSFPLRILPVAGQFAGLPPEVLPLTVYENLEAVVADILSG